MVLNREMETYRQKLPELLKKRKGHYVVIHGEEVVGIWKNEGDAVREGYIKLGHVPFLVKRIQKVEKPVYYFSMDFCSCPSSTEK